MLACKAFNLSPEQLGFGGEASDEVPANERISQAIEQILSREGKKQLDREQSTVLEQVTAPFPFSEVIAQAIILAARELEGAAKMTFDQSKRETLHKLAASLLAITGVSQVGSLAMLDAEQQRWLASPRQTSSASPGVHNEALDRFEQLIAHCWQLSRGKQQEISLAKALAVSCLPTLTTFACQASPQQQQAADLAAQWYRLCAILGYHTENVYVAEEHAQNAVIYSKIANNPDLIVASLALHALVLYYANRPEQALEKCTEADLYLSETTYAVQSFLYRRKAACLAQLRQDKQALITLDLAFETFQQHPANETPHSYAEHNEFEMLLWEGITRYHVDQQEAAITTLEQLNPRNPTIVFPERIRTGFMNNLIFAELRKPTQKRDMERCITLWQEAAQSATNLQSKLRYDEVVRAYSEMLIAFPGESRLKELRSTLQR
jgi:tetratricopeptide (TPR) repeat protein